MSERKGMIDSQRPNGAAYDCDFEINMKRLNSHIIPFQRQMSRPEALFQTRISPDNYLCDGDQIKQSINRSVEWSKQLSRDCEGILPGYMEKTVTSRMAITKINLKTLQMNCTNLKDHRIL